MQVVRFEGAMVPREQLFWNLTLQHLLLGCADATAVAAVFERLATNTVRFLALRRSAALNPAVAPKANPLCPVFNRPRKASQRTTDCRLHVVTSRCPAAEQSDEASVCYVHRNVVS